VSASTSEIAAGVVGGHQNDPLVICFPEKCSSRSRPWILGAMHDDRSLNRGHDAPASPKKSVAGRARGDLNPPRANAAGLIF
jgi:hypothetical protein